MKNMKQQQINQFISKFIDRFPPDRIPQIELFLERTDIEKLNFLSSAQYKKPLSIWFWSFFAGIWGIDRFMIHQPVKGILKSLTVGGLLFWWFIDLFCIIKLTQIYNYRLFLKYLKNNSINN